MNQETVLCELSDLFGDAVYSYTREMAIEDGSTCPRWRTRLGFAFRWR